jgi:hypothetical protein
VPDCQHLLIDGYNILHTWPTLKDLLTVNIDIARDRLGDAVRIIHDYDGIRTTLIYDGRGREIEVVRPSNEITFSYIFTPSDETADKIIEQLVANANRPQGIFVATRDNMIRETVSALGAQTLSPEALMDWVQACERGQTEKLKRMNKDSDSLWRNREDQ